MTQSNSIAKRLPSYNRLAFINHASVPPNYDSSKALAQFNALDSSQKAALSNGIAVAASSTEGIAELKDAARVSAEAAGVIEKIFGDLDVRLGALGQRNNSEIALKWVILKELYRDFVAQSRKLAVSIAEYAISFEDVVIKFCDDGSLSVAQRVEKINGFISKSIHIKQAAQLMEDRFQGVQDELSALIELFTGRTRANLKDYQAWAEADPSQKQIQDICRELARIDKTLKDIDGAMHTFSGILENGSESKIPIVGLVAFGIPPASPWIMGVGAAIAGVQISAVAGLAIARNVAIDDRRKNEVELVILLEPTTAADKTIASATRGIQIMVEQDGLAHLKALGDTIRVMQKFWMVTANDANVVRLWLENGAEYADYPKYMRLSLMEGVQVYRAMSVYLMRFADGVDDLVRARR